MQKIIYHAEPTRQPVLELIENFGSRTKGDTGATICGFVHLDTFTPKHTAETLETLQAMEDMAAYNLEQIRLAIASLPVPEV
jgi:hypothetical protein